MDFIHQGTTHSPLGGAELLPPAGLRSWLRARFPALRMIADLPAERYGTRQFWAFLCSGELPEYVPVRADWHTLSFVVEGETRVNWRWGRREIRRVCRPGSVSITAAGDAHEVRCVGRVEVLHWGIDPGFVRAIAERELGRPCEALDLIPMHGSEDDRLWELGRRLAAELRRPRYASPLYFETLNTQLAICLVRDHTILGAPARGHARRIEDHRIGRALELIHASLPWTITLEELAAEAGLSPGYFVASFKKVTGRPPHRYILEQRVERAKVLLSDPGRTLLQVALDAGFSSQSHLTSVFRRLAGVTPNGYRTRLLGDR